MSKKLRVDLVKENSFLKSDGTYDLDSSILFGGRAAGICYDKEGYNHLLNEDTDKTRKRVNRTMNGEHHSVYGHFHVTLNLQNVPKILAMVLNNEKEYNTSEKSSRYTPIIVSEDSIITKKEEQLYNKWIEIFKKCISKKYGKVFDDKKILKLAQENARYLVTVFMDTQMLYTTSLRQLNYIVSWMKKYINEIDKNDYFESKLALSMQEFIDEMHRLNLIDERLLTNSKERSISLFSKNNNKQEMYGDVYLTKYDASFACVAQAQRHRTLGYEIQLPSTISNATFFIPAIIEDDKELVHEWQKDMASVSSLYPSGMNVNVTEYGTYENFILKCKERLCSAAQYEIMVKTRDTLLKYKEELEKSNHPLKDDIKNYSNGARCTFIDYNCPTPCGFKEGIKLTRKI